MASNTASVLAVTIGFAARERGDGIVYASSGDGDGRDGSLVRVVFRCRPLPALRGRDVAYAAVEAVAMEMLRRNPSAIVLRVDDASLAADLADHRPVPAALTLAYVRLGCTLNRFRNAIVVAASDRTTLDLTARARAEVCLDVAA